MIPGLESAVKRAIQKTVNVMRDTEAKDFVRLLRGTVIFCFELLFDLGLVTDSFVFAVTEYLTYSTGF